MNHDESLHTKLAPDLEARVVAWVLGESSAFEASELARLCAEQPALAVFKARMENVHGLVTAASQPPVGEAAWRLPAEQRSALLAALAEPPVKTAGTPLAPQPVAPAPTPTPSKRVVRKRSGVWFPGWVYPAAACLALAFGVLQVGQWPGGGGRSSGRPSAAQPVVARESGGLMEFQRVVESENAQRDAFAETAPAAPEAVAAPAKELFGSGSLTGLLNQTYGTDVAGPGSTLDLRRQKRAAAAPAVAAPSFGTGIGSAGDEQALTARGFSPGREVPTQNSTAGEAAGRAASSVEPISLSQFSILPPPPAGQPVANDKRWSFARGSADSSRLPGELKDVSDLGGPGKLSGPDGPKREAAEPRAPAEGAAPVAAVTRAPAPVDETSRGEIATAAEAVSTFSLHVGDASFRIAREALAGGVLPAPATVRPEEFYNAFDYGDPAPGAREPIAAHIEQAAHPFLQQRNLVRIALKVPAAGRGAGQPLHLTVLLDTSGSMQREDRVATVHRAFQVLASLLGPADRVTLIGFARQPRLLAAGVAGDQAAGLAELVRRTPAEGGTNLEEALKLAGEQARGQFAAAAQNRIVLLTDGAANLGDADPARLAAQVVALRQAGIAFDACGVGVSGLDDTVLEALTRDGDGRYTVINSPEEADAGFARRLAGAFRPAAQDVKLQVRFNPARVSRHRLIGFEQHRLREEEFRDERVDAAELAAEEAAVALYQIEVLPEGEGELGEVLVRFRETASGARVERSWPLRYVPQPAAFARATPSLQLAGTAAFLAEKLRGGEGAGQVRLEELAPVLNALRGTYANEPRVQELLAMFAQARRLLGE